MRKRRTLICAALAAIIILLVPILALTRRTKSSQAEENFTYITVWQVDGFEGGRGSRKQYIEGCAKQCFKDERVYVTVTALTAQAVRENLAIGIVPDMISYPAGFSGIESIINKRDFSYKSWCNGAYCLLTVDENADFSDVNTENTVVNAGKDNLTSVASLLSGLSGAKTEEPTNAYVKLIGGDFKYLFGTQRDVFRLITREATFKVKPVTVFNDLYQNVSIITADNKIYEVCKRLCDRLAEDDGVFNSLGLTNGKSSVEDGNFTEIYGQSYEYTLKGPCNADYIESLRYAAQTGDVNKIKNLLK